jgi:hypothetical protein
VGAVKGRCRRSERNAGGRGGRQQQEQGAGGRLLKRTRERSQEEGRPKLERRYGVPEMGAGATVIGWDDTWSLMGPREQGVAEDRHRRMSWSAVGSRHKEGKDSRCQK